VSNHLSYVDIVLLASHVDCVFVSKAEIAGWPGMGFAARCAGTIFVDRAFKRRLPEVNRLIEAALGRGERVVVFPEGTSSGGEAVLPFKPSLLEPAAVSRYPVYCAALSYRTASGYPPASEAVCWWGDMTFGDHVFQLLRMSHFHANLELGQEAFLQDNRKELAQATWRTVQAMYEALPGKAAP
jgi:1-acyl-sn-glycerol-3-phosphate acyltransferase